MGKSTRLPSLFDDLEDEVAPFPAVVIASPSAAEDEDWHEVPAAIFFEWSRKQQLSYCSARDVHAATYCAVSAEEAEWFLMRARGYRTDAERED